MRLQFMLFIMFEYTFSIEIKEKGPVSATNTLKDTQQVAPTILADKLTESQNCPKSEVYLQTLKKLKEDLQQTNNSSGSPEKLKHVLEGTVNYLEGIINNSKINKENDIVNHSKDNSIELSHNSLRARDNDLEENDEILTGKLSLQYELPHTSHNDCLDLFKAVVNAINSAHMGLVNFCKHTGNCKAENLQAFSSEPKAPSVPINHQIKQLDSLNDGKLLQLYPNNGNLITIQQNHKPYYLNQQENNEVYKQKTNSEQYRLENNQGINNEEYGPNNGELINYEINKPNNNQAINNQMNQPNNIQGLFNENYRPNNDQDVNTKQYIPQSSQNINNEDYITNSNQEIYREKFGPLYMRLNSNNQAIPSSYDAQNNNYNIYSAVNTPLVVTDGKQVIKTPLLLPKIDDNILKEVRNNMVVQKKQPQRFESIAISNIGNNPTPQVNPLLESYKQQQTKYPFLNEPNYQTQYMNNYKMPYNGQTPTNEAQLTSFSNHLLYPNSYKQFYVNSNQQGTFGLNPGQNSYQSLNSYKNFRYPYNVNNNFQIPYLKQLSVTNDPKLNIANTNGVIELTFALQPRQSLVYKPLLYVKYRLPYETYLHNVRNLIQSNPFLRNDPAKVYHEILSVANISDISQDLKNLANDEIVKLVTSEGALVKTKVLNDGNRTDRGDIEGEFGNILSLTPSLSPDEMVRATNKALENLESAVKNNTGATNRTEDRNSNKIMQDMASLYKTRKEQSSNEIKNSAGNQLFKDKDSLLQRLSITKQLSDLNPHGFGIIPAIPNSNTYFSPGANTQIPVINTAVSNISNNLRQHIMSKRLN